MNKTIERVSMQQKKRNRSKEKKEKKNVKRQHRERYKMECVSNIYR
jgi:hypothetical protein